MASFSISSAYGEGISLIARRPLSVLVWGLVYWLLNMIPVALMIGISGPGLMEAWGEIMASAMAGEDPSVASQRMQALSSQMNAYQALGWIVGLVATGILNAAIYRAVIRPTDGGILGMKFGKDELWQAFIDLCVNILMIIALIPFILVVVAVGMAIFFAAGQGAGGAIGGVLVGFASIVLFMWLALRFSLAGPATFATGSFQLFESWTLTKGQGWALVGLALLLGLTILAFEIVIGTVLVFAFLGAGSMESLSPEAIEDFFAQPFEAWSVQILPWIVGASLIGALLTGALYTFLYAPFASVYRQLAGDTPAA